MDGKILLQDLAEALAEHKHLNKKEADTFTRTFFDVITTGLQTDRAVKVKGLGTFKLVTVSSRSSVNVSTGERIEIQEHYKVSFTPDTALRDIINRPFAEFGSVVINDEANLAIMENVKDEPLELLPNYEENIEEMNNKKGKKASPLAALAAALGVKPKKTAAAEPENAEVPSGDELERVAESAETVQLAAVEAPVPENVPEAASASVTEEAPSQMEVEEPQAPVADAFSSDIFVSADAVDVEPQETQASAPTMASGAVPAPGVIALSEILTPPEVSAVPTGEEPLFEDENSSAPVDDAVTDESRPAEDEEIEPAIPPVAHDVEEDTTQPPADDIPPTNGETPAALVAEAAPEKDPNVETQHISNQTVEHQYIIESKQTKKPRRKIGCLAAFLLTLLALLLMFLCYYIGYYRLGGARMPLPAPVIEDDSLDMRTIDSLQNSVANDTLLTQPEDTLAVDEDELPAEDSQSDEPAETVEKKVDNTEKAEKKVEEKKPVEKAETKQPAEKSKEERKTEQKGEKPSASSRSRFPQVEGGEYEIVGTLANYRVGEGETLRSIAQKLYGSKVYAAYINVLNQLRNPDDIPVGTILKLPDLRPKD